MTRRLAVLAALSIGLGCEAMAASLEDSIASRWSGAWVVVLRDVTSACDGFYTDNRVNDDLVAGKGSRRFSTGELARLDKLD